MGVEQEQVVRELLDCAVGARQDVDRLIELMSHDVVCYANAPSLGPFVGREEVRAEHERHRGIVTFGLAGTEIRSIESGDRMVFAERLDVFAIGGTKVVLPVVGVFEVVDGKVSAWREFFDMDEVTRQLADGNPAE